MLLAESLYIDTISPAENMLAGTVIPAVALTHLPTSPTTKVVIVVDTGACLEYVELEALPLKFVALRVFVDGLNVNPVVVYALDAVP